MPQLVHRNVSILNVIFTQHAWWGLTYPVHVRYGSTFLLLDAGRLGGFGQTVYHILHERRSLTVCWKVPFAFLHIGSQVFRFRANTTKRSKTATTDLAKWQVPMTRMTLAKCSSTSQCMYSFCRRRRIVLHCSFLPTHPKKAVSSQPPPILQPQLDLYSLVVWWSF